MGLFHAETFETGCRIEVEQSEEHFHAHVELAGNIPVGPGDRICVHGAPISIPFGGSAVFERMATVERAGPLTRAWIKFASYFDFAELYEVSFTPRRLR